MSNRLLTEYIAYGGGNKIAMVNDCLVDHGTGGRIFIRGVQYLIRGKEDRLDRFGNDATEYTVTRTYHLVQTIEREG